MRERGRFREARERSCHAFEVAERMQETTRAIGDDFRNAADPKGDDRFAVEESLENAEPEAFAFRGVEAGIGRRQVVFNLDDVFADNDAVA